MRWPGLADRGDPAAVFQVDAAATPGRGPNGPADGGPEQGERGVERGQPVLGDLLRLQGDRAEGLVGCLSAVEQVADPGRAALAGGAEVGAGQAATDHVKAAFLVDLAAAGLPRRLPVGLHDAARYGPARLVGRLEDQQAAA